MSGDIPQEVMVLWQRLAVAGRVDAHTVPNLRVILDTLLQGPASNVALYKKVCIDIIYLSSM